MEQTATNPTLVPALRPFEIERYFAQHEFSAPYLLCASDCEALTISQVLQHADEDTLRAWESLSLQYTHASGHPDLLRVIKDTFYASNSAVRVLEIVPQEGIYLAMLALLTSREDEVVAVNPAYQSLQEIVRAVGCTLKLWHLHEDAQSGAQEFRVDDLEKLVTPKTKLVIVNFPHNPTGYLPSVAEYERIVAVCRANGAYLFSDEIYRGLENSRAGDATVDRLPSGCTLYEKCISLGGLSKCYSAPGLRVGWLATQDAQWYQRITELKDYTTICGSAPSEILAIIIIKNAEKIANDNQEIVKQNLEYLTQFIRKHSDKFDFFAPKAGSTCFPAFKESFCADGDAVCDALIKQHGILLASGSKFGYGAGDRHFRLGLGRKNFKQNLDKLDAVLSDAQAV